MTEFVFPPQAPVSLPVDGQSRLFPVSRIFCVGANYVAHAKEMGRDPTREPPFFFLKGPDAVVHNGTHVAYPPATSNYQHEVELVVAIGARGFEVSAADARSLVYGYAVGLDMTRRDLQLKAREKGRPWDLGKNFPESAPLGTLRRDDAPNAFSRGVIQLSVNGEIRQSADLSQLIWNVGEIIEHLSRAYPLQAGDLIFTGTPAGVGAVVPGDRIDASIEGLPSLGITVA